MCTDRHQMTGRRWGRGMGRRGWGFGLLLGLLGGWQMGHAADFPCPATGGVGDVACLSAAIKAANANGETNTIHLEAGTYTLTDVDNDTDVPNGLPSITSALTIQGAGAVLARAATTPALRLVHVAASGTLTLTEVTLRGGR